MAGGTWMSQNKVRPGVYINTKSSGNLSASIGEKGIVAIAEPLSWGPCEVIQTIIPGEDLTPYIGYDVTNEKALFLKEMMKGSDTIPGPIKILLYRPKGTGGVKASGTIGALSVTALYEGIRGNDITMIVQEDPDTGGTYVVSTVVDGRTVDEQTVTALSALSANAWVTFSGTGNTFTETAGTALSGGVDPTVANADYSAFLTALEKYTFDIVVYDGTESVVLEAYASFVKRISERVGRKCQAVMAGAEDSNTEWVISVGNGVKLSDGTVLTPQQVTWWLGGAEAGAPYNQSLTYSRYPNAVEASPKLTDTEIEEAIQKGKLVFIDTFDAVKVCTDINTLTSFTVDKQKCFAKNRVMRVLNQFCNDVYKQFSLYYIGKTNNNDDGRNLLKGWIVGYLNEMQANGGVQNFVPDDVEVLAGNEIDAVVVNVAIQPVDSIEKIYMTVNVSANSDSE
ncbi:phage tail sheath family protein [Pilosibacter fragilis]|uniref:phage tail sheath family protein n=1 Tax=Pilosibacter fragilis TaxID=3078042 RepID=UPI0031BA6C99